MSIEQISKKFRTALVGGFPRDLFLGLEPNDKDYVVEATVDEFEATFPQFKRVGNSFPVYIVEGNEVALSREEKSIGSGYTEFEYTSGVTIEEDLSRRDFSISSIAIEVGTDTIIDPFFGVNDIVEKVIRSINVNAFIDDPLRIIRGFRFATRFNFEIEANTLKRMKESVHLLATIVPERIELEIRKVYKQSEVPSDFFRLVDSIGGLKYIGFEQFEKAKDVLAGKPEHHPEGSVFNHLLEALDYAKANNFEYHVAISAFLHDLGKIESPEPPSHIGHDLRIDVLETFFSKHRFSADVVELSKVVFRHHMNIHNLEKTKKPVKLVRFFKRIPKHRRDDFFLAVNADSVLNDNQKVIINNLKRTFKEAVIDIPNTVVNRGKEAVVTYVEAKYAEKYKEISK